MVTVAFETSATVGVSMTAVAAVPPGVTWFEPEVEFPLFPSSLESDEWEQAVSTAPPV